VADIPRVPLALFEGVVEVPTGWAARSPGAYVHQSEPYAADARLAAARGWPVTELPGTHLDIVTQPATVAAAIDHLARRDP